MEVATVEQGQRDDNSLLGWSQALLTVLDHAIEHLQLVIFDERMDSLVSEAGVEAALRESVSRYEQGLAHLFGVVRASGVLESDVAWSTLKADQRRSALDAGLEISLRTALETGMYGAESIQRGDHLHYRAWSSVLLNLLRSRATDVGGVPLGATDEARLYWAYDTISDLEDHDAFHRAVLDQIDAAPWLEPAERDAAALLQSRLLAMSRFDLILNACLLWLAEHGGQAPSRR